MHTYESPESGEVNPKKLETVDEYIQRVGLEAYKKNIEGFLALHNPDRKDPRDTLIEAQREYIELVNNSDFPGSVFEKNVKLLEAINKIQAAQKAIKGG